MSIRALVVGGTGGIGFAMACRIAASSPPLSSIIISGRNKPADMPYANMEFRPLDATSMRQIKQYTTALKASGSPKLSLLVMTQGIMTMAGRTETAEGIDRKMALHYYGRQLLIRELLPILAEDARVILVYDGWLGSPNKLIWDDLGLKTHFSLTKASDHCMAMGDAMVQYWAARQLREGNTNTRHFVHAWPGGVNSGLLKEVLPWYLQAPARVLGRLVLTSPDACAERLLRGAEERAVEGREVGRFWSNIDNKGRLLRNKAVWTEEQMNRVADHTWETLDAALAGDQQTTLS
ncbi:hypothetical protein B0T25DRAFT_540741 [Lasiosphaeria hispida]|uniref:Uncharacterized protein n=1 Tax=Lasiosphaeria hispida TaxID=260671 RepID=A0AAJ0HN91_9PEZI|nr:hypothetical protein B0T25DRAFT_540741 [Lasiosphaeria hispida]